MKKIFLTLFFFLNFSLQTFAMTYYNEPQNFEGIPWGAGVGEFAKHGRQIVFSENKPNENIVVYKSDKQNLFIFNKNFDEINYHFYNGRFFMVTAIKRNDNEMSQTLYQTIKSQHAAPTQQNDNVSRKETVYWWQGDTTYIRLAMDYKQNISNLTFYNKNLYQQWTMNNNPTTVSSGKIKERGK